MSAGVRGKERERETEGEINGERARNMWLVQTY